MPLFLRLYILQDVSPTSKLKKVKNGGTFVERNIGHVEDDEGNDKWMCVKKDCLFHVQNEHTSELKNNFHPEDVMDNMDKEWICVNKECLFHNHDDENVDSLPVVKN
jgi:hypothetical protein